MTMVPQPASAPPTGAATRPRSSRLTWLIVGIGAALVLIIGVVVAFVLLAPRGPGQAVTDFDTAYDTADCDLFAKSTTEAYRTDVAATCEDFKAVSADFTQHYSAYTLVITGTKIDGDTATITTSESWRYDGDPGSGTFRYDVVKVDGVWKIDGLTEPPS